MTAALDDFPPLDMEDEPDQPVRRTRKPRDPNAPVRTRQTSDAKLAAELMEPLAMLGQAVSFMSPTGGAVIIARGEVTSSALVKFAKGHPKMRAALANISKVTPAAELIQTLAMVLIAIQVDLNVVRPEAPIVQLSGVGQIYWEMREYMEEPEPGVQVPTVGGAFKDLPPPPDVNHTINDDGTWQGPPQFSAGPGASVMN